MRSSRRTLGLQPEVTPSSDPESGNETNNDDSEVEDTEDVNENVPGEDSPTSVDVDLTEDKDGDDSQSSDNSDSDEELIIENKSSELRSEIVPVSLKIHSYLYKYHR